MSLLVVLLACAVSDGDASSSDPPPALVRVAEVEPGELTEDWTALADVRALERAELAAGASGPVTRVEAREGDRVDAGTVLVEVDLSLASARVRSAEAAVRVARVELQRLEAAFGRRKQVTAGVLAAEELGEAAAAVEAQQARVDALDAAAAEARAAAARHVVRAPFSGVVTERSVDRGDWVDVGRPVMTLVSTEAVEARVRVPRALATRLEPGTRVGVGAGSGTVLAVVPALEANTRTALVRIAPDADAGVVVGDAAAVRLPVAWKGVGVRVPRDALLVDPSSTRVLEVVEGAAQAVVVDVIATSDDAALVLADALEVGDRVVTRGNERVRPGQPVRIEGAE